jgi:hypothetical protein
MKRVRNKKDVEARFRGHVSTSLVDRKQIVNFYPFDFGKSSLFSVDLTLG